MKRRRGHREGSIYRRKSDGRWVALLDLGWQDGHRKRKAFYAGTRAEVQRKLDVARRQLDDGIQPPPEGQRVGTFLERWLRDVARVTVRPSTYQRYSQIVNVHLIPAFGQRPLNRLSGQDLQELYARKQDSGLAPRTVGHIHRLLHRALADAVRWGLVGRNVCDAAKPPKVPKTEMRALSGEEAQRLLAAADGDRLEALYYVAVTGGLRQGEILALKWSDIDLDRGVVEVKRSHRRITGRGILEGEPKSGRGRSVILGPRTVEALRRHRKRQVEERLAATFWADSDLIFQNEIGRPIEASNLLRRSFFPLLARAGIERIRFHDLRHTAATLQLARGVNSKIVSERLGHSQVGITLDLYSHVTPTMQRGAAVESEAAIWG